MTERREVLVIGGGPAGVSAAIYARRAGRSVTLLADGGGALSRAEKIENYYGLPQPVSGAELAAQGLAQAERLGVECVTGQAVDLGFGETLTVSTPETTYAADAVVLAVGSPRQAPKLPGLAEFDGKGVSWCAVCDGFFCRGRHAAVLGSGEYAMHEAAALLPLAGQVTILTDGQPLTAPVPEGAAVDARPLLALEGDDLLRRVTFTEGPALEVARLFVALGTAGAAELAKKVGAVTDNGRIAVDSGMATNVPGLFAAGDCTGGLTQVAKAVYEGAQAGLSAAAYVRKNGKGE